MSTTDAHDAGAPTPAGGPGGVTGSGPAGPAPAGQPTRPARSRGVPLLAALAMALVAGLVGFTAGTLSAQDAAVAAAAAGLSDPGGERDPRPTLGSPDAPVTVEIYSDFACPFCVRHDREVEPTLVERYVDTGQVLLVWHDTPFQGPRAAELAIAARAAARQDAFWEMKEAIFAGGSSASGVAQLRDLAVGLGLDGDRFVADLEDPALLELVQAELGRSQRIGVSGTPTFIIAGEDRIIGAQPLPVFIEAIERALAAA